MSIGDGWISFDLSLEQQLMLRNAQDATSQMKREELSTMVVELIRQLEVQKSVTRQLMKRVVLLEAGYIAK